MLQHKDPRVGLSIDNCSQSCPSDLSDSESSSWDPEDYVPFHSTAHNSPLPDGSSWNSGENNNNNHNNNRRMVIVSEVPRTASFRSRLRPPRRQRRQTAGSWDDDVRITQHPQAPSLRFCMTLGTLMLVLLSLASNTATSHPPTAAAAAFDGDIRQQEQVRVPVFSSGNQKPQARRGAATATTAAQVRNTKYGPDAGHAAASRHGDSEPNEAAAATAAAAAATGARLRVNVAMARSAQNRPIFGAQPPPLERFLDGSTGGDAHVDVMVASNWHSWLAAVALVAMLLETGYKEYRRCRIMQEEQRRL